MPLKMIERMLGSAIGFDASSIGEAAFVRAIGSRLRALSLQSADAYLEYLRAAPTEIQDLVEAVVVSETWFFREPEAFATMVKYAREWSNRHPTTLLRLLSLPCSTGEEPHSMAMALVDAGFPVERFRIDAVDVSSRAIAAAKRGIYGKNSFRGMNVAFRTRHFKTGPEGASVSAGIRGTVRFMRANLLDADFIPGKELYDIIFCRNMLIYFDDAARDAAVAVLDRLLSDDGMIFVGPSESGLMLDHGLASVKAPLAFAFQKPAAKAEPAAAPRVKWILAQPSPATRRRAPVVRRRVSAPALPQSGNLALKLEDISRIADQGQLAEAERACATYLLESEPTADVLLLLGIIRDAGGDAAEAADYYRKALYLDPNHAQVLLHLALLLEKQGDIAGAKIMNDRLRRQGKA